MRATEQRLAGRRAASSARLKPDFRLLYAATAISENDKGEMTKPTNSQHLDQARWIWVASCAFVALGLMLFGITKVWSILSNGERRDFDLFLDLFAIWASIPFWLLAYLCSRAKREGYPGQGWYSRQLGKDRDGDVPCAM